MPRNILIVDDEPSLRLSLRKLLENKDYKITSTSGIQETNQLDSSLQFDLAIVDLNLGDGKGTDLISSLRKKQPQLQSILITGESSINVTIVESMNQGIFDFMPKPFEPSAFLSLVKEVLKRTEIIEQNKNLKENIKKQFHFESNYWSKFSHYQSYGMDA